jgi:predicted Zn-dependent peptidase
MPQVHLHSGPGARRTVLPNGVRVLTERLDHVGSVSLGVWLANGSKDEPAGREGITHLLEHMLFKGTASRSASEIAEAGDQIGGNVNGFTDREWVYLYARTIAEHTDRALELLFDLLLNSVCADEELEREKQVVVQEIHHVEDVPEERVHSLLLESVWQGHPLGRPLTGRPEAVGAVGRESLLRRLSDLRAADRIIVCAAGRVEHERIADLVGRMTGELQPGPAAAGDRSPPFQCRRLAVSRPTEQVHFCLASPGRARTHPDRHAIALLDAIVGGATSSRLFQEIREKRGLAYSIGSYLESYAPGGLFVVDAGTTLENFDLVLDLIAEEAEQIRTRGVSGTELERAKTQFRVGIAVAAESTSFRAQHLAGSEMYWGRVVPLEEIAAGIDAVTAEDVQRLAGDIFDPEQQALVAIGPFPE